MSESSNPVPATHAAPRPTPSAPPPPPQAHTVSISLDQLKSFTALQTRVATMEADHRQREAAAVEERLKLQTAKGEAENAVKTLREQKDAELARERDARTGVED